MLLFRARSMMPCCYFDAPLPAAFVVDATLIIDGYAPAMVDVGYERQNSG